MKFLHLLMFLLKVAEFVAVDEDDITWPPDLVPKYCADAIRPWETIGNTYEIEIPNSELGSFKVYCIRDSEGGPAWTVILRRMDGSVDFFRNWASYEIGFGDLNGEHFLGLKKIHELTNSEENELWVELMNFQNESRHAKYSKFSISGADKMYSISVANYSGNAGDSLTHHNGDKFDTKDIKTKLNCAKLFRGAWWMDNCYKSHLLATYKQYNDRKTHEGIHWHTFNHGESLKYAHMAIRPVKFSGYGE